jgi:hypothetical protein
MFAARNINRKYQWMTISARGIGRTNSMPNKTGIDRNKKTGRMDHLLWGIMQTLKAIKRKYPISQKFHPSIAVPKVFVLNPSIKRSWIIRITGKRIAHGCRLIA